MQATGSSHDLALRKADFSTLCEALDYAAQGATGVNFYNARGEIYASATYAELRDEAMVLARRLMGLGIERGGRVALDPNAQGRNMALTNLLHLDVRISEDTTFRYLGERVYVRFDHGSESFARQVYRMARQVFLRSFDI